MRSFLFVLGSTRDGGNTEILARRAAESLPADVSRTWLRLSDLDIPLFEDVRHDGSYPEPHGVVRDLLDATLAATDVVIASPLYWYSVSAGTKLYLDHWSGWLRVPHVDFKAEMRGKTLWGVTALAERDPGRADHLTGMLRFTAEYMKMDFGGVLLGNGSKPGDVRADAAALGRAEGFFAEAPVGVRV